MTVDTYDRRASWRLALRNPLTLINAVISVSLSWPRHRHRIAPYGVNKIHVPMRCNRPAAHTFWH